MAEKTDYELTAAESRLLLAVTQDATAGAGALGGSIGAPHSGGAKGGAAGGRLGARFLRPQTASTSVEVPEEAETALERVRAVIGAMGAVIEDPNGAGDGSVWGIVSSGAMGMMPALVRVDVEASGSGGSRVHVRATGREGLIKQKIGAKAVDRIGAAISQAWTA